MPFDVFDDFTLINGGPGRPGSGGPHGRAGSMEYPDQRRAKVALARERGKLRRDQGKKDIDETAYGRMRGTPRGRAAGGAFRDALQRGAAAFDTSGGGPPGGRRGDVRRVPTGEGTGGSAPPGQGAAAPVPGAAAGRVELARETARKLSDVDSLN